MSAHRRILVDHWGRLLGFEPGEFRADGRFYATGPVVHPDRTPEDRPPLRGGRPIVSGGITPIDPTEGDQTPQDNTTPECVK